MHVKVGTAIRRIRGRLRRTQSEFAEMLGSQRNSIGRYEIDMVQPSLPMLWKLYNLAEKDEKGIFESAIRERIGTDLAGVQAVADIPMSEVRQFVAVENQISSLDSLNPYRRRDFHAFITAAMELLQTARRIDPVIPDLITLWRDSSQDAEASAVFRQAASYLRVALARGAAGAGPAPKQRRKSDRGSHRSS